MKKNTLIMICCASILMLSSGAIWGQHGVLLPGKQASSADDVSTRRGDITNPYPFFPDRDYIHGAEDVSVVFGAGESSVVRGAIVRWPADHTTPFSPNASSVAPFAPPYDQNAISTVGGASGPAILIGSYYSKNAVVGVYDNDGKVSGGIRDVRIFNYNYGTQGVPAAPNNVTVPAGAPPVANWYDMSGTALRSFINVIDASHSSTNIISYTDYLGTAYANLYTSGGSMVTGPASGTWNNFSGLTASDYAPPHPNYIYPKTFYSADVAAFSPTVAGGNFGRYWGSVLIPYRSQYLGGKKYEYTVLIHNHIMGISPAGIFTFTMEESDTMYTSTRYTGGFDDGKTLLIELTGQYAGLSPNIDYDDYVDKLLDDSYVRPTTVLLTEKNTLDKITIGDVEWYATFLYGDMETTEYKPFRAFNATGCNHYSGWISFIQDNVSYDTIATHASGNFVDAAVRLLDHADVCVTGNVLDSTKNYCTIGSGTDRLYKNTDALLVLPGMNNKQGVRSNFRLKIGGDAAMLHTQDSGAYIVDNPLKDGYLYSDAYSGTGPGAKFPTTQVPVYLSSGTSPILWEDEVAGLNWNYEHPREDLTLTYNNVSNPAVTSKVEWMPFASTYGSVYGVGGLYEGGTAIHTKDVDNKETSSIIEIGKGTNNQHLFNIYSMGMLKNFRGCNSVCAPLILGAVNGDLGTAPKFFLTTDDPLYIINDGNGSGISCCDDSIVFHAAAVYNINTAIRDAIGGGDLHIQSVGAVKFRDNGSSSPLDLDFTLQQDNEIKILSDHHFIHIENNFKFIGADMAHLTIWAKGDTANNDPRGFTDFDCPTGAVVFDKDVTLAYDATKDSPGVIFIRSENDDVLVGGKFSYTNEAGADKSGELIVQAGQDIRIDGTTDLKQDGNHSMLFEAKKSIYFGGDFTATMGSTNSSGPCLMHDGDLSIIAGYDQFFYNADVTMAKKTAWNGGWKTGSYRNRNANDDVTQTGGDIWFQSDFNLILKPCKEDSIDVFIRAFNTVNVEGDYNYTLESQQTREDNVDSVMYFAESGNYEAIYSAPKAMKHTFGVKDSVYFLMQAGNLLGKYCETGPWDNKDDTWHGNVLFLNKTFTINQDGVGPTLISAARDIENQVNSDFTFNYTNPKLSTKDSMTITAGRHIETHAPYTFNFDKDPSGGALSDIWSNITMQAGHYGGALANCTYAACRATELASHLAYNVPGYSFKPNLNEFAEGGSGNGSILLFSGVTFNYAGKGDLLMTALNGNVESDPYLHGAPGAKVVFNNSGQGLSTMEAINIKLHDAVEYNGSAALNQNGNFKMFAFDSILTRNVSYTNNLDAGSVLITTDKFKSTTCDPGIHQGHIVLGYGADCSDANLKDTIKFDFNGNLNTTGANLLIQAGYKGYDDNSVTGLKNSTLFKDHAADKGKAYGGNITFDFMQVNMAIGNGKLGGYAEISTPNGNIWGKDSLQFHGINGNLLIDAGLGSLDDTTNAVRWFPYGDVNMLNTYVPYCCEDKYEWRTGNIMLKGGSVDFNNGTAGPGKGNVTFRTREGFIDVYDRFDATNMTGHLLKYAGSPDASIAVNNQWGDLSERDFQYSPVEYSGSVFFGADDNIMLNYGNSNGYEPAYHKFNNPDVYSVDGRLSVRNTKNPFYSTFYKENIDLCFSTFNVNTNGYLWYFSNPQRRTMHRMYRGCESHITGQASSCSPLAGRCETIDNGARPLTFNFNKVAGTTTNVRSGGLAVVASNYIDLFTAFTYEGGTGSGLHSVPEMGTLKGENVAGYGLYIKSIFNGPKTEIRRATCFNCGKVDDKVGGWAEWPYVGFHDDARIHTEGQKSLVEAPVVEFFGHAELDAFTMANVNTELNIKADSMIFHDSAIFSGTALHLLPLTISADKRDANAMRYGVVNDADYSYYYHYFGPAIEMPDRQMPILELGYQRCYEPPYGANLSPNKFSQSGGEATPQVGGDIIVSFKNEFALPIYNTVVANHARISFLTRENGGEYVNTFIRTDLLRIRNKVEFYTDPAQETKRVGTLKMTSYEQMPSVTASGIYPHHIHLEPNSELSIPGEDSLIMIATTTIGGYGNVHENVFVKANATIAPGYASLMEHDCTSGEYQGMLTVHDLVMEKDAILRISIGNNRSCIDPMTGDVISVCTQTDTLHVQGTVYFMGKIPMYVLPEVENIQPGCYLFLIYDELELSPEYIHNLELQTHRIGDLNLRLDKSERGRVYLCVTTTSPVEVQRYIDIHIIDGVTSDPVGNLYHYVWGHDDFTFKATYSEKKPFEVYAIGYYSQKDVTLTPKFLYDGTYEYTIRQVTEPWDVWFSTVPRGGVGNDDILNQKVWAYRNTLFVNVDKEDVVSIYNATGVLYQKINIPAGLKKVTLDKGIYIVTLKNGSVYKIIIN